LNFEFVSGFDIRISNLIPIMTEIKNSKRYDLEDRTILFAGDIRNFVRRLKKTTANIEDTKQVVRSSGSVGANYIEANEALSKKDFKMRIKICRKEAKETRYWLQLLDTSGDVELDEKRGRLIQESTELMNIFGSILTKTK
jgi:four helix bundle protein